MGLTGLIGRLCRSLPPFRGKDFLARHAIAPLVRGRGNVEVVELEAPVGGRLLCDLDDWIPWNVYIHGRYTPEAGCEACLLSCVAPDCRAIFDVGANIGYYTVRLARLAPRATVHAFEPVSYQGDLLRRSVQLNELDNVIVNKLIVSDSPGRRRIYYPSEGNSGQSSLARPGPRSEDVDSITLDAYCLERGIDRIDVIKVDVEGHEPAVLRGMAGLLSRRAVGSLFCEVNADCLGAGGSSREELLDLAAAHGYRPWRIAAGRPEPYVRGTDESLVLFRHADDAS